MPTHRNRSRMPGGNNVIDLGPDLTQSGKNEDLYIFTLENVTLKKGQRMVVALAEYELKYRDVFVLDLPFGPPPEVRGRLNNEQQAPLARLFHAPKVMHKIRLTNDSQYPLTTAPALILSQGQIIAQNLMTYTAVGASCDLDVTSAVDISVEKLDEEIGRTPEAQKWNGHLYGRFDLDGTIKLTNHRTETVELEVGRSVLGQIDSASHDGIIRQLPRHERSWHILDNSPFWWSWYDWPYWWYHFNSIGRASWKIELKTDESIELKYKWHYFWRH